VYVEPFGGAASILLAKEPSRIEVYNDIDEGMVSLFRVLRDPASAQRLIELLELTPFSRREYLDCMTRSDDPVEEARRMIVLSFQSIGSKHRDTRNGWRTRTAKSIWSPCSAWNSYPPALKVFSNRMREVIIECLDFRKLIEIYDDSDALFYLDPPYPAGTRSNNHNEVYAQELSDADHRDLVALALGMKSRVIVSSYANSIYDDGFAGWDRITKATRAQTNAPREEVLYMNPACRDTGLFA
jgi:DNA adenine methylase